MDQKILFYFPILFLTPFCNLKLYFCVFKAFYTQIPIKTPEITSPVESASKAQWGEPQKSSGERLKSPVGQFFFPILFLTFFCDLKLYFCVFKAFDTQILIKTPKIKSPVKSASKVQWRAPRKFCGERLESPVESLILS